MRQQRPWITEKKKKKGTRTGYRAFPQNFTTTRRGNRSGTAVCSFEAWTIKFRDLERTNQLVWQSRFDNYAFRDYTWLLRGRAFIDFLRMYEKCTKEVRSSSEYSVRVSRIW